ncbi:hypothetical protein GALMADRAFT_46089, partial [Galerina marginata CBS 339.88]
LIRAKKAPRGAIAPLSIQPDGLFKLDVDDDIWQDVGLTDENDDDFEVPAWLGNDDVRSGIKALLDYERCVEEERRLIAEKLSMIQWICEEWTVVMNAIIWSEKDPDLVFQLNGRKSHLLRLCVTWEPYVRIIPLSADVAWGPNDEELADARAYEFNENTQESDMFQENSVISIAEEEEIEWSGSDDEENDAEVVDDMESDALQDNFR